MRGVWRPLLPNMLKNFTDDHDVSGAETICNEIVAQAAANNFIWMELDDINEVLNSGNEELTDEDPVELEVQNLLIVDNNENKSDEPAQLSQQIIIYWNILQKRICKNSTKSIQCIKINRRSSWSLKRWNSKFSCFKSRQRSDKLLSTNVWTKQKRIGAKKNSHFFSQKMLNNL